MFIKAISKRVDSVQNRTRLIWIISTIIGATVFATAILVIFHLAQHRRRRDNSDFREACLRDPGLTWEEYERKGRLTRSRILFEEEIQRSNMIRKSQQSRTSDRKVENGSGLTLASSYEHELELGHLQRSPSRSKSWHGRSKSTRATPVGYAQGGDRGDPEDDGVLAREVLADWNSVHASVERTWQLLHGRKYPTSTLAARRTGQLCSQGSRDNDNNDAEENELPSRPPTVRLKTPPLLSHPIFRDGNTQYRPKHMSLPTELTRAKTEPRRVDTASSGLDQKEEGI